MRQQSNDNLTLQFQSVQLKIMRAMHNTHGSDLIISMTKLGKRKKMATMGTTFVQEECMGVLYMAMTLRRSRMKRIHGVVASVNEAMAMQKQVGLLSLCS